MDAKVHPARPVHHQDAEETIGLVRRDLRRQRADGSAGPDADHLDAAAHHHHSCRELSQELGRDFPPSASADAVAEWVDFLECLERSAKLLPDASAGRERGVPVAPVEKVVGRLVQVHQVAEHQNAAHLGGAMARRVAVQEWGAKQEELAFQLKRLELEPRAPQQARSGRLVAEQQEPLALGWLRQAELRAR
jgi:hypothetical protein